MDWKNQILHCLWLLRQSPPENSSNVDEDVKRIQDNDVYLKSWQSCLVILRLGIRGFDFRINFPWKREKTHARERDAGCPQLFPFCRRSKQGPTVQTTALPWLAEYGQHEGTFIRAHRCRHTRKEVCTLSSIWYIDFLLSCSVIAKSDSQRLASLSLPFWVAPCHPRKSGFLRQWFPFFSPIFILEGKKSS